MSSNFQKFLYSLLILILLWGIYFFINWVKIILGELENFFFIKVYILLLRFLKNDIILFFVVIFFLEIWDKFVYD